MWRYILFALVTAGLLFALDAYVFRAWRRFAAARPALRWTLPLYQGLRWLMPLSLPLYFLFSRWWEVEPRLPRMLLISAWALYYLPRVPIVLVLAVKDAVRALGHLRPGPRPAPPAQGAMTRSEFLRTLGWSAATVPFAVVGHGLIGELYDFRVHRVTLRLPQLPRALEGMTIVQLSDIHAGSFPGPEPVRQAIDLANSLRGDLLLVTGDFVNHHVDEMPIIEPSLRMLRADLGVFASLGNHDHYADVEAVSGRVRAAGLDLMVNEHRTLDIGGARLHLIGTDNTGFNQHFADMQRARQGLTPDPNGEDLRILLAHDPTFWDTYVRPEYPDIDVTLSGHTHGGQIGFELGPLRWSLARMAYHRWAGLYAERSTDGRRQLLYVNRGLGTVGPAVRIGIRPEITHITLARA